MIKKICRWIQLWGLMYYAHGDKWVLISMASVLTTSVIIGGILYPYCNE